MAKRNWMNEIVGGEILSHGSILKKLKFPVALSVLVILYITINFGVDRSLLKERKNQRELKHLKSDYVSKLAKLQYNSKRTEVEKRLKELNSTLKPPVDPPTRVIMEN